MDRYPWKLNRFSRKIKFPSLCSLARFHGCQNEEFGRTIFERCFKVRDFCFWITEGIGLTGVSFHYWPQKQIPSGSSYTNFWFLFHFHVKHLPIFMFLGLIWCKILCTLKHYFQSFGFIQLFMFIGSSIADTQHIFF
jgi:hypothetical protein